MMILLDNGHGSNTEGKMSPNGLLREWHFTRLVAKEVQKQLQRRGYDSILITPESRDIALSERVRRANEYTKRYHGDTLLVSIHLNAAGDGSKWVNAGGWECYTSRGTTKSDRLAECLYTAAAKYLPDFRMRKDTSDGDSDKEADFYILKHTACPAVLTENLFMDGHEDYLFLTSSDAVSVIAALHVEGIINYIKEKR